MRKGMICTLAAALMAVTLAGCGSKAEEAVAPADAAAAAEQAASNNEPVSTDETLVLTEADKLKSMSVGETAVWKDYEVTVESVERTGGNLVASIAVKSHGAALSLGVDRLLSFGMPPIDSSFADGVIQVPAGEPVSGTLTFDDQYTSQRLFWNDGATEATWLLDAPAEEPKKDEKRDDNADKTDDAQKKAVKNIEKQLPDLFANNTYYTYQGVDSSTAKVTPQDDGSYLYENSVSVLDGNGDPATANVRTWWDSTGKDCTSMELDGTLLF